MVRKVVNILEEIQILIAENKELNSCLRKYIDECEKLTGELKERELKLKEKDHYIAKLSGMVEAFEICVKARRS